MQGIKLNFPLLTTAGERPEAEKVVLAARGEKVFLLFYVSVVVVLTRLLGFAFWGRRA